MTEKLAEHIRWHRRNGTFGNRHHGRFPRISVTASGAKLFWVVYCRTRHEYNHGSNVTFLMDHRELQQLRIAAGQALRWKDPLQKNRRRARSWKPR